MQQIKRVVIKVGSNVLTNTENRIAEAVLESLVHQIAQLHEQGIMAVLVTSGSVIAGKEVLGESAITNMKEESVQRQVFSSVGQPRIMRRYYRLFHDYGMRCGQVLATKRDFSPGKYRENMINCYEGLLAEGIIPIANEDDAVSLTMSMFSDNDELASLVAELIQADMLIILTHTEGLYTGHPSEASSELLNQVKVNENVEKYIQEPKDSREAETGGMGSKLKIAKRTAAKDIPTYIANGKRKNVVTDIVAGKKVGTCITV